MELACQGKSVYTSKLMRVYALQVNIRLTQADRARLERLSLRMDTNYSDVIRQALTRLEQLYNMTPTHQPKLKSPQT